MKRILDCQWSDFKDVDRASTLYAISSAEGWTISCESICSLQPMLGDITNAEFAAAMGVDILLLNVFDVHAPTIRRLPKTAPEKVIRKLKELTGIFRRRPRHPPCLPHGQFRKSINYLYIIISEGFQ